MNNNAYYTLQPNTPRRIVRAIHSLEKSSGSNGRWVLYVTSEYHYNTGETRMIDEGISFWRKAQANACRVGDVLNA